jgi:tetratricopeptide (TPR) repeat protein
MSRDPSFRIGQAGFALAFSLSASACHAPAPVHSAEGLTALKTFSDSAVEPLRPRFVAEFDTNDATAYYQAAVPLVRAGVRLETAEAALYWASRLDPTWADPIYARAVVVLRALRNDAFATFWQTRSARAVRGVGLTPRQAQLLDSLRRVAWARNPFLFTGLDFVDLVVGRHSTPEQAGLYAFKMQRFAAAESLFAVALRQHPGAVELRIYRAQALFFLKRYDDAVAELGAGRDSLRSLEREHVAIVLPSVEMFEYAIGFARAQQDDFPPARAALERALTENFAFYWAHARLAGASLSMGDTAAALTELETAVQLEGRDPALRFFYGVVLLASRRLTDAEEQLRTAIGLDPDYAASYHWLGAVYRGQGKAPQAIEQYRTFLARAARSDPERAAVSQALASLGAAPADSR